MRIIEYTDEYKNGVKELLNELQEYVIELDPYKFNKMEEGYSEVCFEKDYNEVKVNDGKIFLAIEDDIVIGLIMGAIRKPISEFDYERKDNMGEITELIVTKKIRSKGVGHKLMEVMENYFKEKECKTINIDVFGYNDIAKDFYFINGYHTRMMTVSKKI